jgi:mRNA-degrading endonuclease toxin of MazEF toxin-antitoxin module
VAGPFPRRGEIYLAGMRTGAGDRKSRPVLILSPDVRNRWAGDVLAVPLSTQIRPGPTHVILDRGEGGLPQSSVVKCEQITCLDKGLLEDQPLGQPLSQDRIFQIEDALLTAVGIFR